MSAICSARRLSASRFLTWPVVAEEIGSAGSRSRIIDEVIQSRREMAPKPVRSAPPIAGRLIELHSKRAAAACPSSAGGPRPFRATGQGSFLPQSRLRHPVLPRSSGGCLRAEPATTSSSDKPEHVGRRRRDDNLAARAHRPVQATSTGSTTQ